MEGTLKNVTLDKSIRFFYALSELEVAGVVATRSKGMSLRGCWIFWWDVHTKTGGFLGTHSVETNFDFTPQGMWIYDCGEYGVPPEDEDEFEEYYYSIKDFIADHVEDIFNNNFDSMLEFVEMLAKDVRETYMNAAEAEKAEAEESK